MEGREGEAGGRAIPQMINSESLGLKTVIARLYTIGGMWHVVPNL